MRTFLQFTIFGLATGGIYAVSASGLVLTYTTSGVFNFAHGAMGMLMAFLYWELRVNQGWPTWLAVIVVVFVVAPLMGAVIERTLIRNLEGAPLVTSLVVTIGLMLGLMALAAIIWPTQARRIPFFFGSNSFRVVDVAVTYHRALALGLAVVIAVALGAFLRYTRSGLAMRAVVDSRPLSALNGSRPGRSSMISWAIGASLAAVSGILLAPLLSLTIEPLTLLVVYSYAAAVFGRLTSLPLTFVGAMIIGLAQSYVVGYLPTGEWAWLGTIGNAIPVVALFIFLLIVPPAHLRGATLVKRAHLRVPSFTQSLLWGLVMLAVAYVIIGFYDGVDLRRIGQGLAFSIIALSLVPLTGYAGQISLCQMTFAGLGAWAMAEWGTEVSALGLIAAVVIAGVGGFVVALPTLRLQGLYLALATMSFAAFMDAMFFRQRWALSGGGIAVSRLELGPVSFESQRAYFMLLALTFVLLGMSILWIRRGAFGRRLIALRDSPAALETLGLSVARTRLTVFTLSAGMAGLGGALLGGLRRTVGPEDFNMFMSLPVLVLAVVGGVTTVVGPLFGGMFLSLLPWLGESRAALGKLAALAPGLVGIGLGRNPDGVVAEFAHQRDRARGDDPDSVRETRLDEVCAPGTAPGTRIDPERIPMLDQALELDVVGAVRAMEPAVGTSSSGRGSEDPS